MTAKRRDHRDIFHKDTINLLHRYGCWTRSQETGKFVQTEPGSADIMCIKNGGCAIEIKTAANGTFRFEDWRENQRLWCLDFEKQTGCTYWLMILFDQLDSCPFKEILKPRVPYLIPATNVLMTETLIPQESIPYIAGPGMNKEMQEEHLDASHLWLDFALQYYKGWSIPVYHPFAMQYLEDQNGS